MSLSTLGWLQTWHLAGWLAIVLPVKYAAAIEILLVSLNELLCLSRKRIVLADHLRLEHFAKRIRRLHEHDDLTNDLQDQTHENQNREMNKFSWVLSFLFQRLSTPPEANEDHQQDDPVKTDGLPVSFVLAGRIGLLDHSE